MRRSILQALPLALTLLLAVGLTGAAAAAELEAPIPSQPWAAYVGIERQLRHHRLVVDDLAAVHARGSVHSAASALGANGQPMLIHVWSVHCPPCVREMPRLSQLFARLSELSPIRIVLLAEDTLDALDKYLKTPQAALPDSELYAVGRASQLRAKLQHAPLPLTLMVDEHMVIREAWVGELASRQNELLSTVERLCSSIGAACRKPR